LHAGKGLFQSPRSASLIAHTRLTLFFLQSGVKRNRRGDVPSVFAVPEIEKHGLGHGVGVGVVFTHRGAGVRAPHKVGALLRETLEIEKRARAKQRRGGGHGCEAETRKKGTVKEGVFAVLLDRTLDSVCVVLPRLRCPVIDRGGRWSCYFLIVSLHLCRRLTALYVHLPFRLLRLVSSSFRNRPESKHLVPALQHVNVVPDDTPLDVLRGFHSNLDRHGELGEFRLFEKKEKGQS
jgi:hypothetical protein